MNEPDIRALLFKLKLSVQRATFTGSKKRTRWMNISCPFAPWTHSSGTDSHPSFGITISDDDRSYYKCLACGVKGRLSSLPTKLGGYRKKNYSELRHWAEMTEINASTNRPMPDWEDEIAEDYEDEEQRELPSPELVESYPTAVGIRYLRQRGIKLPTIYRLNLRYDDYQQRVLFPCYDQFNRFRGFTGRSILKDNNATRGKNPKVRDYFGLNKRMLFLGLRNMQPGKKIISEGLFDYAAGVQHGYLATRAILGTSLTEEKVNILINEGEPVYFFMDNDLAGWQALFGVENEDGELDTDQAWAFRLYEEIPVWIVPYKKQLDGLDPGSMSKTDYDDAVNHAWLFTGKPPTDDLEQPTLQHPLLI